MRALLFILFGYALHLASEIMMQSSKIKFAMTLKKR